MRSSGASKTCWEKFMMRPWICLMTASLREACMQPSHLLNVSLTVGKVLAHCPLQSRATHSQLDPIVVKTPVISRMNALGQIGSHKDGRRSSQKRLAIQPILRLNGPCSKRMHRLQTTLCIDYHLYLTNIIQTTRH